MTASPEDDALGRKRMTLGKRVELLERDRAQQSRVLTAIVDAGKTFTPEQIAQLRAVMREVFAGAGLRLDDAENQDEAREDFRSADMGWVDKEGRHCRAHRDYRRGADYSRLRLLAVDQ